MKKNVLITFLLAVMLLLVSCNSLSVSSVPVNTPTETSPVTASKVTDSEESEGVTLTDEQNENIYWLFTAALSMSGGAGEATFFQNAATLSTEELLGFAYTILCDNPGSIGEEFMDTGTVSSQVIKDIIYSAFGIDYTPQKGDCFGSVLHYNGDGFNYEGSDGIPTCANIYRVARMSSGNFLLEFNIIIDGPPEAVYLCNGEAVVQEDEDSLFGYRILSLKKVDSNLVFTDAEASTCLPANGSISYSAENVIDDNDNTVWAANSGVGERIKLTFGTPEDITGLVLHLGDRSSDEAYFEHAMPLSFDIRFSDGSECSVVNYQVIDWSGDHFVTFDEVINTSYVEITITEILEGTEGPNGGVYISEIKPF